MKTIHIITFLTILTLFSCKTNNDEQFKKQIIGEWAYFEKKQIKNGEILPSLYPPNGYIFHENGDCETKLGFIKRIERTNDNSGKILFLGTKTKYKINDDSLKIFNIADSTWITKKINSINGDTLTLQSKDSSLTTYVKPKYILKDSETYDKIIVSSSGCYGWCPILDISIDRNGNVIYFGEHYNTVNGLYTSKISKEEYLSIETNFKKADIPLLNEGYFAGETDNEEVTITFIKDNKIFKTITDYGQKAPIELFWAYTPVRYLYQRLKLTPFQPEIPKISFSRMLRFETKNQICELSKSESFYLTTEFYKSKEVNQLFEIKYTIKIWKDIGQIETYYTDGRYFKFKYKNGYKTMDLGYNFILQNDLMRKFRDKNEYE